MDQPGQSPSPRIRSSIIFGDRTAEPRDPLSAELPDGWVFNIAAAVAADLVAPVARHPRLRPVLLKMLSNLSEELSLCVAAKVVNLAPKSFSRFFPEETGFCFCSWDTEVRIRIATYLLHETDRSIDSIGRAVGYRDQTTFGRAFKKCHGIAARPYRRSLRFARSDRARAAARGARAHKR